VSADSTDNVVQMFGYFQVKRFEKALELLTCAYEANLDAEQNLLEALTQIGWEEDDMLPIERTLCEALTGRADIHKQSGKRIKKIMREIFEIYGDDPDGL